MADAIEVRFNLREFKKEFDSLSLALRQKGARSAGNAAAQVVKKAIIARAPEKTGTLKRAIYVTRDRKNTTRGQVAYTVGVRSGKQHQKKGRDAFYWRFLEDGWIPTGRKKVSGGRRARALARERNADKKIRKPFIGPAFGAVKQEALQKFISVIDKFVARQNRSGRR